jgi:hypothetical protein
MHTNSREAYTELFFHRKDTIPPPKAVILIGAFSVASAERRISIAVHLTNATMKGKTKPKYQYPSETPEYGEASCTVSSLHHEDSSIYFTP